MSAGATWQIDVVAPAIFNTSLNRAVLTGTAAGRETPRAGAHVKRVSRLSPHSKDRACGSSNHSFGNTAQHESLHAATALGSNDDEVGFPVFCLIKSDLNGVSRDHDLLGDDLISSGRRYNFLERVSIALLREFIDPKRVRLRGA